MAGKKTTDRNSTEGIQRQIQINKDITENGEVIKSATAQRTSKEPAGTMNKKMVENLEKFEPIEVTESGKNLYSEEDKTNIYNQLESLLQQGYNVTMAKKSLAIYHNTNTSRLDRWRKETEVQSDD